jgi:uncharacterized protein YneF (UPF0154 family)
MTLIILKILAVLALWTIAGFILGPPIGRFLKRRQMEQSIRSFPLPQGSILGKSKD